MVEVLCNVTSGLAINYFLTLVLFDTTPAYATMTTAVFTLIAIGRGYFWRRIFK